MKFANLLRAAGMFCPNATQSVKMNQCCQQSIVKHLNAAVGINWMLFLVFVFVLFIYFSESSSYFWFVLLLKMWIVDFLSPDGHSLICEYESFIDTNRGHSVWPFCASSIPFTWQYIWINPLSEIEWVRERESRSEREGYIYFAHTLFRFFSFFALRHCIWFQRTIRMANLPIVCFPFEQCVEWCCSPRISYIVLRWFYIDLVVATNDYFNCLFFIFLSIR